MATNPSHILIARNSRNNNNPSASLSIATETHAAAAGVFRSAGSPPWTFHEHDVDIAADISESEDDASIDIDDTFTRHSQLPGAVKIVVESTSFW
jgi:FlaG/FlaF family flagellin (archaellin)